MKSYLLARQQQVNINGTKAGLQLFLLVWTWLREEEIQKLQNNHIVLLTELNEEIGFTILYVGI